MIIQAFSHNNWASANVMEDKINWHHTEFIQKLN